MSGATTERTRRRQSPDRQSNWRPREAMVGLLALAAKVAARASSSRWGLLRRFTTPAVAGALLALAPSSAGATALPAVLTGAASGNPFQVRPAEVWIGPTAGAVLGGVDGSGKNGAFGHLRWSTWNQSEALGSGVLWLDNCEPDCARGRYSAQAVTVRASASAEGHFTRLSLSSRTITEQPFSGVIELRNPRAWYWGWVSWKQSGPTEPCDVQGLDAEIGGQATAGIFAFGDDGSLDVTRRSDGTLGIDAAGDFKVGLGGVFGDGVNVEGEGAGVEASVAAGLELGIGLGFTADTSPQAGSLIDALKSANALPPSSVELTSSTLEIGAWLSGDIGVEPADGSLDASAVLGVKTDYESGVVLDNEYYLEVNASGGGNAGALLAADSTSAELKNGGFFNGDLMVGETVDPSNHPVSGELMVTGALGGQSGFTLSSLDLKAAQGGQAEMTLSLDLSNPHDLALWNKLTSDQGNNTDAGLIGNGTPTPTDDAVTKAATITVVLYRLSRASASAQAKFGDGAGIGVKLGEDVTERTAIGAQYKPPGSLTLKPWDSCVAGGGALS